ncbi:hypothetical protein [Aneurinibacillus terranovensis]|uniref:hypothetical protein n=1 Tax=Aneurinibacillus terranovensis TaxID=278991 RepID=UPI0003FAA0C1|nr:hypothetical protein [Aneurinibacillus terranovensis]
MHSLEKRMFFIPNRLAVRGREMMVSFNIAPIPTDMSVMEMVLHIPAHSSTDMTTILAEEIAGGWDETLVKTGYTPPHPTPISLVDIENGEAVLNVSRYEMDWRFNSHENHGIFLSIVSADSACFSESNPPYLVLTTI